MIAPTTGTTITPQELAAILDLVGKVSLPVNVTLIQLAPIVQRAMALASLPAGTRIGAIEAPVLEQPAGVPAGTITDPVDGGA